MLGTKRRPTEKYYKTKEIISKKLFPTLRKRGFLARMNFSCCSTCASYELAQMAEQRNINKIVFYHHQDDDTFKIEGGVYLRYFLKEELSKDAFVLLGHEIKECAEEVGLKVEWNGNPNQCIKVTT